MVPLLLLKLLFNERKLLYVVFYILSLAMILLAYIKILSMFYNIYYVKSMIYSIGAVLGFLLVILLTYQNKNKAVVAESSAKLDSSTNCWVKIYTIISPIIFYTAFIMLGLLMAIATFLPWYKMLWQFAHVNVVSFIGLNAMLVLMALLSCGMVIIRHHVSEPVGVAKPTTKTKSKILNLLILCCDWIYSRLYSVSYIVGPMNGLTIVLLGLTIVLGKIPRLIFETKKNIWKFIYQYLAVSNFANTLLGMTIMLCGMMYLLLIFHFPHIDEKASLPPPPSSGISSASTKSSCVLKTLLSLETQTEMITEVVGNTDKKPQIDSITMGELCQCWERGANVIGGKDRMDSCRLICTQLKLVHKERFGKTNRFLSDMKKLLQFGCRENAWHIFDCKYLHSEGRLAEPDETSPLRQTYQQIERVFMERVTIDVQQVTLMSKNLLWSYMNGLIQKEAQRIIMMTYDISVFCRQLVLTQHGFVEQARTVLSIQTLENIMRSQEELKKLLPLSDEATLLQYMSDTNKGEWANLILKWQKRFVQRALISPISQGDIQLLCELLRALLKEIKGWKKLSHLLEIDRGELAIFDNEIVTLSYEILCEKFLSLKTSHDFLLDILRFGKQCNANDECMVTVHKIERELDDLRLAWFEKSTGGVRKQTWQDIEQENSLLQQQLLDIRRENDSLQLPLRAARDRLSMSNEQYEQYKQDLRWPDEGWSFVSDIPSYLLSDEEDSASDCTKSCPDIELTTTTFARHKKRFCCIMDRHRSDIESDFA